MTAASSLLFSYNILIWVLIKDCNSEASLHLDERFIKWCYFTEKLAMYMFASYWLYLALPTLISLNLRIFIMLHVNLLFI